MTRAVDHAEVRRIARLARLKLSDDEVGLFAEQLTRILQYVSQIESLETDGVEPFAHPLRVTNVLREDRVEDGLSHEEATANAADVMDGCFRVPAVLGDRPGTRA